MKMVKTLKLLCFSVLIANVIVMGFLYKQTLIQEKYVLDSITNGK